jgi:nucleotide-binding universal stress UspA family protein
MVAFVSLITALAVLWTAEALLLARWMARRGHDMVIWLLLGMLMGPVGVGLAVMADAEADLRAGRAGRPVLGGRRGPIDVLVGLDGSAESEAAFAAGLKLFEARLGRVTVVTVVDLDRGDSATRDIAQHLILAPALERLAALASAGLRVSSTVVAGRASVELARLAREGGYNVVVVGARGHGLSELLVGSTVEELLRDSPVPVLVGPALVGRHQLEETDQSIPESTLRRTRV